MKIENENAKASKTAVNPTCARVRGLLLDAACGLLAESRRAACEAHLGLCADCTQEFQHVQNSLRTIDDSLRASVGAAEPSPEFAARVRQAITEEKRLAPHGRERRAWLTATAACVAVALFSFAVLVLRKPARPPIAHTAHPSAVSHPAQRFHLRASVPHTAESAKANSTSRSPFARRKLALAVAHKRSSQAVRHRPEAEMPQVIVQPGQMKAILAFVAEVQNGQISGAQIAKEMKASDEPIRIKPLVIKPLEMPPINGSNSTPIFGGGVRRQDSVTGQSN